VGFTFLLALTKYLLIFRWPALLVVLAGLGLTGCASDKNLVAHSFNNVAARDNAYFLARQKLRTVEDKLYLTRGNDYNQVLPLFPTLDSAAVKANRTELNDIIKKASMPIQHRPGSDWTDDAYLLVGWSRYYQMQFDDAALTFKYVNSTSKDDNAKHEALVGLMRTFVALKEFDNAKSVSNLLDKETGLEHNARELFLTRADYYIRTGEPLKAIPHLEKAIPLIEFKNERSRTRYILAQLYQEAGEDKKAYEQLNLILARNPPYELDFQAKLMLGQVSDLNLQDRARLDKYFAALLKDPKNKEYRDKIYYEMARLEYRQQHYPQALELLRKSAKEKTPSRTQKGYTYLLAGRIYYENLQKYRLAAAYYDSTVQSMSKEMAHYDDIKERAGILKEFAKQYTIIETQDSLQALARLAPDELTQRLNTYAAAEIAQKKAEAAKKAKQEKEKASAAEFASRQGNSAPNSLPAGRANVDPTSFDPLSTAGAQWYFDNPASLGTARADFIRKWGDRKLADNWRNNRQSNNSPNTPQGGGAPLSVTGNDQNQVNVGGKTDSLAKAKAADPEVEKQALVAKYRKDIPLTPDLLKTSDTQVEAAMYELGTIYKEQLKEKEKGIETYEKEVKRYVRGKHSPDAYYLLYLYYKDKPDAAKMAEYAAALQREFPETIYAKLIADPLYREHERALAKAVSARLDQAFELYKEQDFTKAKDLLTKTELDFPKHEQQDRVAYLKTLLVIRTQPPLTARASVEQFYKDYPKSALVPQAQALANTYKNHEAGKIVGALASTEKPGVSMFRPGEVDNRMRILYGENESPVVALPVVPTPAPEKEAPKTPQPAKEATPQALAPAGSAGPAPAPRNALEPASAPAPAPQNGLEPTPPTTPATGTAPVAGASSASSAPTTPATAYTTQLSAAHAVVLVFPKGSPATTDLATQLGTYNSRFYKANNLQVQPQPLGTDNDLFVVRPLVGSKVAQSYASKLRGPQSPIAKLHGQGYQALVISLENLTLLQSTGDLTGYLTFYQSVYK
jgi:tetratricopeptide (TPR) repeat protein